ncbi:MAG: hypothetical protein AB7G93_02990 [Bdellovibrionales bacterium]
MRNRLTAPIWFALLLTLVLTGTGGLRPLYAQEPEYEFEPPRPPPLDGPPAGDFEDFEQEPMDSGEDYAPPPPPPPPPSSQSGGPQDHPPGMPMPARPPGFRPPAPMPGPPPRNLGPSNFGTGSGSKLRFEIVEGEYWAPKKKRSRGKKIRPAQ